MRAGGLFERAVGPPSFSGDDGNSIQGSRRQGLVTQSRDSSRDVSEAPRVIAAGPRDRSNAAAVFVGKAAPPVDLLRIDQPSRWKACGRASERSACSETAPSCHAGTLSVAQSWLGVQPRDLEGWD